MNRTKNNTTETWQFLINDELNDNPDCITNGFCDYFTEAANKVRTKNPKNQIKITKSISIMYLRILINFS